MRRLAIAAGLLLLHGVGDAPACTSSASNSAMDANAYVARGDGVDVVFKFDPPSPALGQLLAMRVNACDQDGQPVLGRLRADAVMPAHGHGMNYTPKAVRLETTPVILRGLVFHMPGVWRLLFTLRSNTQVYRATYELNVGL
jgi:hypothetical protein